MAKCPKCHKEIDHLDVVVTERTLYTWRQAGEFDHVENIEFDVVYWKCPECYAQLDIEPDEDSAEAFITAKTPKVKKLRKKKADRLPPGASIRGLN